MLFTYENITAALFKFKPPALAELTGKGITDRTRNEDSGTTAADRYHHLLLLNMLTEEQLTALGGVPIVPSSLLLRAGVGYHLAATDSMRLSTWACAGPAVTAGGGGGALSGWSSNSSGISFHLDVSAGHNAMAALFLAYAGCKSVAIEHRFHQYFRMNGPSHLRSCSRGLRQLTVGIRKIDETASLKNTIPRQIGFISGLQEIYARRVGLTGRIPPELCMLRELRVSGSF
jgi:hypothetical protein